MYTLEEKEQNLRGVLRSYKSAAFAFSGGVDSTLLVYIAHQELDSNMIALTCRVPMTPSDEIKRAQQFCLDNSIATIVCNPEVLSHKEVRFNAPNRCYVCKKTLFSAMLAAAKANGFALLCDGTNLDDLKDYRPGLQALTELSIASPFVEAGFTKQDIRLLSQKLGLSTWNMQSNACLATRFPYGSELSPETLYQIDELERELKQLGFSTLRVRAHGNIARIEVPVESLSEFYHEDLREKVCAITKAYGFVFVTLDLEGFRSGSMNATLPDRP